METNKDNHLLFKSWVPDLQFIKNDGSIIKVKTVKDFRIMDDRITVKFAEVVSNINRGWLGDIVGWVTLNNGENFFIHQKDLLLVYIDMDFQNDFYPEIEYTFYK